MSTPYYDRSHLAAFSTIGRARPELARQFFAWYGAAFAPGALGARDKALAALAVAHVVQCPYCIDAYTSGSLEKGADRAQLSEAVHLAAACRASSTLDYARQALDQAAHLELRSAVAPPSAYFDRAQLGERPAPGAQPGLDRAMAGWFDEALAEGALELETKAAILVACAHALQCPYTIHRATDRALDAGLDTAALIEAVHVAAAIRGGASLIHGLQMLDRADARWMGPRDSEP